MLCARCLHSRETVFMLVRRLKLIFSHIVPLKCLNTVKRLLMCVYVPACVTCLKLLSAKDRLRITWRLNVGKTPNCPNLPDFFEMDGGFNSHLTLQTCVCRCKQSRGVRQISKSEKAADRVNVEWAKKQDVFLCGKGSGNYCAGIFPNSTVNHTMARLFLTRLEKILEAVQRTGTLNQKRQTIAQNTLTHTHTDAPVYVQDRTWF